MVNKALVCLILTVLLCSTNSAIVPRIAQAAGEATIYVVPTITDDKILPTSSISSGYISNQISIAASPSEFEPASFVVRANQNISDLQVQASSLTGASGSIPSGNVDIRVIKCWYQSAETIIRGSKVLTPELLLKDDSLVKVENGENYLKVSGDYYWISGPDGIPDVYVAPKSADFPVQDSATLQPVDIPANTNKQFWITVEAPDNATAGDYSGTITLTTPSGTVGQIQLNLRVLPIELSESMVTPSIYNWSRLGEPGTQWEDGTISYIYKSETQFEAEIQNLADHGITNPAVNQGWSSDYAVPSRDETMLRNVLQMRQDAGMLDDTLYYLGLTPHGYQSPTEVAEIISVANDYGINNVYFYGVDEALSRQGGTVQQAIDRLNNQRDSWNAIRAAGGKIFASGLRQGFCSDDRWPGNFGFMGDIQDMLVCFGCYPGQDSPNSPCLSSDEAALWHSEGHQIFAYHNPQVGPEKPGKYRRNFGLALWQANYDGMMNFSYQTRMGHIWNDFDHYYRDHNFTYPTVDGVIDTIQWEGQREGIDDLRYLATLIDTIDTAKAQGKNTSSAENYLASLKSSDLTTKDLDSVRSEIIDHIIDLQGTATQNNPPVLGSIGSQTIDEGESLQFIISATDLDGNNLSYSASNLPSGANFDTSTRIFSWTPGYDQAGTYNNVHLEVSDGSLNDSEDISITVNDVSAQPPSISFVSPTDNNNATIDRNWTEVNVSVDSTLDTSSFIDWNRSLVGYWDFDDNSGSIADDRSTYTNNASLVNSPLWTAGKYGSALSFDNNDYVNCGNNSNLNITDEITIEAWVNPATAGEGGSNNAVIAKAESGVDWSWQLRYNAPGGGNYLGFQFNGNPEGATWVSVQQNLTPEVWYHVVGVFDGTNIKCYLNGTETDSSQISAISGGNASLLIGQDGWSNIFNGNIDEVRIWNRALSSNEIKASYNSSSNSLSRQFTSLDEGTYQYSAYTTDTIGSSAQTEARTLNVTSGQSYDDWDVNQDGSCNVLDMTLVGQHMGESGTAGWIREDVNNDGTVDVLDMILIGQHLA